VAVLAQLIGDNIATGGLDVSGDAGPVRAARIAAALLAMTCRLELLDLLLELVDSVVEGGDLLFLVVGVFRL
jgi:hypothetical protein